MCIRPLPHQIEKFIELLKGKGDDSPREFIKEIFTNGNCYNFAFALKALIPEGKVLTSSKISHAWFMYDGRHYDISGVCSYLADLHNDGLTYELFEETLTEGELDNYSMELRGPMI
jgi:hypothetical protein